MQIKIGHGTFGDVYEDIEKVKACNYCIHFKGYGLHACSGFFVANSIKNLQADMLVGIQK